MKKTLSLVGLLFVGLMLLANPTTGILAAPDAEAVVATAEPTSAISGDPPPDLSEDDATTTTISQPTTTIESATAAPQVEQTVSYSVVGSVEDSKFGPFQVEVFFEDGAIVAVDTLQLPTDRKSTSINNSAVPLYEESVVEAQSADIDVISGATVTWSHYTASLQSALDEASL